MTTPQSPTTVLRERLAMRAGQMAEHVREQHGGRCDGSVEEAHDALLREAAAALLTSERSENVLLRWAREDHDRFHRTDRCPQANPNFSDGRCWDNCKTCDGRGTMPTPFDDCLGPRCVEAHALNAEAVGGSEAEGDERDIRAAERYLGRRRPNVAGGRVWTTAEDDPLSTTAIEERRAEATCAKCGKHAGTMRVWMRGSDGMYRCWECAEAVGASEPPACWKCGGYEFVEPKCACHYFAACGCDWCSNNRKATEPPAPAPTSPSAEPTR